MRCPRCRHENRAAAKFCEECAEPLATGGSRFISPDAYTPKHLADKILSSRAAVEGERKQVTVLFADLESSMELLADRNPEESRGLLDPVLTLMMEAVHRYEGTVSQVMGDGIMALFGAPLAHEEHAVRACYAALTMQELMNRHAADVQRAYGVQLQIRVGLNSGEVVVGTIGRDLHMAYTAVGQTTHLAARMEQLAAPGSILLTSATLELVEGFIAAKPLGLMPVKGLSAPIEIYEVTGAGPARTRLQAAAWRGLTPFVGRDAELEQLRKAQQLADSGRGQIAAIVGEAGVGKSRLMYQFTQPHRQQGWRILESVAVSYDKATSYAPVIDLLKAYFNIQDRDDLHEIKEKVTGNVLRLDRALEPTLPALLALLDLPVDDAAWGMLDPGQRRQRILDAVTRLLLREAQEQPVLLIFEDLHWIDAATQALLDRLVEGLSSARLLLIVSYRPEYQDAWGSKTCYTQMWLHALPSESAGELLEALLGDDPGLIPLKQLLVRRGNPFFLEETIRTLVETKALKGERGRYRLTQPIQAIQVPATVQVILAARIDRLAPEEKRLLQTASVVGRDVPWALLQAIVELSDEALRRGLDHLQAAEFVYETGIFPDLEYSFKHALTHDVTYGGLLQGRRRELHARIVTAIETLHRDRLGEHTERLAHHAFHGELGEKAVSYLRQAGLKADARSALSDARVWFEQGLGVLTSLPETPSTQAHAFDISLELARVLGQLGEVRRALEPMRQAEALAEQLNDDRQRGRVCAFETAFHSQLGELDEALVTGTRALEIAGRLADLGLRILTTTWLAQAHYLRGDYARTLELATGNLAALPADQVNDSFGNVGLPSVLDRLWLVLSLSRLGRFAEAAEYKNEAIRLAELTQHAFTLGSAYRAASTFHFLRGDWAKARELNDQELAVFRTGNVGIYLPEVVSSSAWVLAQLGDVNEALSRLREGEKLVEGRATRGLIGGLGSSYHSLGRACLLLGRLDEAQSLAKRAVECSPLQVGFAAYAHHLLGDIAAHPDRLDAESAEAHYRQALALAEPRGMRPLVAHCHLGLGTLFRRTAKHHQAQQHLGIATTIYRETGMRFWLDQANLQRHEST